MFLFIYHLILIFVLILGSPLLLLRMLTQRHYRKGLWERLGFYPKALAAKRSKGPTIWIHGSSVGEIQSILPLLDEIKLHFPEHQLFFSATTMTGVELLRSKKLNAIYFPLDLIWISRKAIEFVNPSMIWILETELWPSFVSATVKRKIPLVLVNGRISDFSFRRYRLIRLWVRKVLNQFSLVLVQSQEDQNRFLKLGLYPEKLRITGNLKFDSASLRMPTLDEIQEVKQLFSCENSDLILVAGSTHPGEEEILGQIYLRLSKRFHSLRLIVAPRHLTRLKEIEKTFSKLGLPYQLKSKLKKGNSRVPVVLLDTLGELYKVYGIANLVFVGKSLTGLGGQNPLEPASLKKPILFGPHMENFREAASALLSCEGAICVQDSEQLENKILDLLHSSETRNSMGQRANSIFASHQGASDSTWAKIKELLRS